MQKILSDAEIEAVMQANINEQWPPSAREKAMRLGGPLLDQLNAFFLTMSVEKQQLIAARDVAKAEQEAMLQQLATEAAQLNLEGV